MRLTDEKRRHVIIKAAERVARDNGLAAVTHGAVAKRCTVETSTSTVRRYFPRKDDLWDAVLDGAVNPKLITEARELGVIE